MPAFDPFAQGRTALLTTYVRGRATGPSFGARSRLLDGEEARRAARAIAHRQPILQGVLVPLAHKLMRYRTLHYELTPDATLEA